MPNIPLRHGALPNIPLRHGAFLPPFHPLHENPAACIDRDLELMQWLDRLGFNEAWIGSFRIGKPKSRARVAKSSTCPTLRPLCSNSRRTSETRVDLPVEWVPATPILNGLFITANFLEKGSANRSQLAPHSFELPEVPSPVR